MSTESLIGMQRLNPTHKVDNEVYMGFFPPSDDYYTHLLQDKSFVNFLMSDGTTKEGQDRIADFYQVAKLWKQMEKSECNYESLLPTSDASQYGQYSRLPMGQLC